MSMRIRVLCHPTAGGLLFAGALGAEAANLGFLSANGQPMNRRPRFCRRRGGVRQLQQKR